MARKPEDVKPQDGATPAHLSDNDVPLEQMPEANAQIGATRAGTDAPAHEKVHPKVHKSQDEEPVQDTTDQPVVEDEP
ncbi:hypothetical protein [Microvirga calopogonii]|uniref:hypothetical protein n=1 Tax=Microvirga calopogonii TaxID=2078013 RepID=UPI0013B375F7|nr:hypothetical protein [Microvirga calopogonii]